MRTAAPLGNLVEPALRADGYNVMAGPFRAPQGFWHWHQGIEVVMLHSGSAEVSTQDWRARILPGEAAILSASNAHGIQGVFNRTVIHFTPELLQDQKNLKILNRRLMDSPGGLSFPVDGRSMQRLIWIGTQLNDLSRLGGSEQVAHALLNAALAIVGLEIEQGQHGLQTHDIIHRIIAYMTHTMGDNVGLETVSQRFGISNSQLWKLFVTHLGCSPGQYWLELRLDHACRLLSSEARIEDIAAAVGFGSLRGFQRAFRRRYGMSPSEFRGNVK